LRRPLAALAAALLALTGCGGAEGVEEGAAVSVYSAAGPCAGARAALSATAAGAGKVSVRLRCLPPTGRGGRLNLAVLGANARRAVEDSTTVAYIGEPGGAASRFSRPILEEADIAQLSGMSGAVAMGRLLAAIDAADLDSGALREQVRDQLGS
jgi:branched-chain amino acid transport system substrate-binding protein